VVLSWQAPSDLGGSTSVYYALQISKDAGATWASYTTVAGLTVNVPRPTKGQTWSYRVAANTSAGLSDYSNVVSVSVSASAATAPNWSYLGFNANGSIDLRWTAPADNGGSAITEYIVEKSLNQTTWTSVGNGSTATTLNVPREAVGARVYFRLAAKNATGVSPYSYVASIQIPFTKASAPQNFSAVDATNAISTTWTAPTNLGGATSISYTVQVSRDNGSTWSGIGSTTALTLNVSRPPKGSSWIYRVIANTNFGASDPSTTVSIAIAATAPSAVSVNLLSLNTSTSTIDIRWTSSSDNGGSALTGYILQRSVDNVTFTTVANTSASTLTASVNRDAPGVRSYWRVAAVNAIGTSAFSSVVSILMPYLQASAVQNFAATDNGSYVTTSWVAPTDLGGSPSIYYYVQYSVNGGNTWLNYVSTTATSYNVARPAKGTSALYRVVAVTAFGAGVPSQAVSVTSPATVPSVPSIRSFVLNPDRTSTLTFNGPSDLGGSPLVRFVVETSINGGAWSVLTTTTVAGGPVAVPAQAPGVRIYVRVSVVNGIGTSLPSSVYSVQMPLVQASPAQNLTINAPATSSYVTLSWSTPANLGGASSISSYQIQASADGTTWSTIATTSGTAYNVARPAKGLTLSYRVVAFTSFGAALPSNLVSASTPVTAPTNVSTVVVTRQVNGTYNVAFNAPVDLGGVATWTYKIAQQQGSTWAQVQSGSGAATNVVNLPSPSAGAYVYYRITAINSVGESTAFTIVVRG
jgi:titin